MVYEYNTASTREFLLAKNETNLKMLLAGLFLFQRKYFVMDLFLKYRI